MKQLELKDILATICVVLVVGLIGLAIGSGCTSCAHAATLRISMTAPLQDNGGLCGGTAFLIPALDSVWVFVELPALAIRDSLRVLPGAAVLRTFSLPPGTYSIRAYAARFLKDGTKISGCDTVTTKATISSPGSVGIN
jgi:hypothetical protein